MVIHWREYVRLTNTGLLAAHVVPHTELYLRGAPGTSFVEEHAPQPDAAPHAGRRLLLYAPPDAPNASPSHAAAPLGEAHRPREGELLTLLVPDGSWTQSRRMVRREPIFAGAEMVTLPPGAPSRYRLRRAPAAGMLSTFEAVARALALLEDDPSIEARMDAIFERWVEAMITANHRRRPPRPRR